MKVHLQLVTVLLMTFLIAAVHSAWDPYDVLGLKRAASTQDIRKAYKQYAKEW